MAIQTLRTTPVAGNSQRQDLADVGTRMLALMDGIQHLKSALRRHGYPLDCMDTLNDATAGLFDRVEGMMQRQPQSA